MTREEAKKYLEEVLDGGYVSRLREAAANGGDEFASNMAETVQRALNTLGIRDNAGNVLTVNGVYDTPTIQAMGKFIRQSGYSGNGVTQYSEIRSTGGVNPGYDRITTTPGWTPGKEQSGVYEDNATNEIVNKGIDALDEGIERIYNIFTGTLISSDATERKRQYKMLMEEFAKYFAFKGYVIAEDMLRHSFSPNPTMYIKGNNSTIANAMRNSKSLRDCLEYIVGIQENAGRTYFDKARIVDEKNEDLAFEGGDLEVAIHGITGDDSFVSGRKQADGSWKLTVHIEDVYDYAYDTEYVGIRRLSDQIVKIGVNYAKKAQEIGVINPYLVIVDFTMDYRLP